jgi:SAM-dependent methyltransferase
LSALGSSQGDNAVVAAVGSDGSLDGASRPRVRTDELPTPDPALHHVGKDVDGRRGEQQLALLQTFGLHPRSRVVEVGCGLGRLARQLAGYLDPAGTYAGFDISPVAISWLQEHYAPRLPDFRFDLLDVHNPRFREGGQSRASEVRFPYDDDAFDLGCAFEVFMHMDLAGVRTYLAELARVLEPGGVALVTFMAIRDGETEPVHAGRPFVDIGGGVHTRFPERPGMSMGYRVALIEELLREAGLEPLTDIVGAWHHPWAEPPPGPTHGCDAFVARNVRS